MTAFNGKTYTSADLMNMSMQELVDLYNQIQASKDGTEITKFSDKQTGIKRVTEALRMLANKDTTMEDDIKTSETKKVGKGREKHFNFPVGPEIKESRGDTLRTRVRDLLQSSGGATFDEVIAVVKKFDDDRNIAQKNVDRRAYEVVRILHYVLGYGLTQNSDGKIFLVSK